MYETLTLLFHWGDVKRVRAKLLAYSKASAIMLGTGRAGSDPHPKSQVHEHKAISRVAINSAGVRNARWLSCTFYSK